MFLLATLLIGGMMFSGCKKDDPKPTPTPTPATKTVVYKMDNTYSEQISSYTATVSPCFHYTFSYKDANGTMVEVNNPTLPWTKENHSTSTTPNFKEFHNKQQFLDFLSTHPDMLNFSFTMSVN